MLTIDVISDTMCPWCFIGKRRLEKALARLPETLPDATVEVRWKPYRIAPDLPPGGMDRDAYLKRKFGTADGGDMYARIAEQGAAEGIPFDFAAIERSPNTLNSHRVIAWAGETGHADAVVERLFNIYFVEGGDIGDTAVLADAAAVAGMDGAGVAERLDSEEDLDTVQMQIAQAHAAGISGVPAIVIAQKYLVPGAQPPEVLLEAIQTAHAQGREETR